MKMIFVPGQDAIRFVLRRTMILVTAKTFIMNAVTSNRLLDKSQGLTGHEAQIHVKIVAGQTAIIKANTILCIKCLAAAHENGAG